MDLNINEIFETAKHIEKSGYKFYREAAKRLPEYSEFLNFLATEEVGHEAVFNNLQNRVISKDFRDSLWNPDNIMSAYFQALADSAIFNSNNSDIEALFTYKHSIKDVMEWAIKREQDSVLYFTGLRESLKDSEDKKKIEEIISEEIKHIHLLVEKKNMLL